ncbi:hypothetical protein JCM19240_6805 [Vibrio maritimus]|uniref:Uncharacterized protein n=1 Tax=Vibrio maritimus TaxID=990268 RepID=A0A090U3X6_9VIBR|nr:hypothetical protein JCM19240_6805 [Vibrio maritimus]
MKSVMIWLGLVIAFSGTALASMPDGMMGWFVLKVHTMFR